LPDDRAQQVTQLLADIRAGDSAASVRLLDAVYGELRRIAQARLGRLPPGNSLQATELVHEAYLRMAGFAGSWESRREFFTAAAVAMRNVLVERYRARKARKRGGDARKADVEDVPISPPGEELDFLAVERALKLLDAYEPRKSAIFMMRHYMGLEIDEIVENYGVPRRTVERDLSFTRAWLRARLDRPEADESGDSA
jgi:RNA polymerase sigma factor (TIGR02999 family)